MNNILPVSILIVEDSIEILLILHRIFQIAYPGYTIVKVSNGSEALGFCEHATVALVVTDLNMPIMNVIELTRELRKRSPTLPIVMITAYSTPDHRREALNAGVTLFIPKPFILDDLLHDIEQVLPKHEKEQST